MTGQVGRQYEGVGVGRVGEHPRTAGAGTVLVLLEAAVDVRLVDLDRAVQQVTCEDPEEAARAVDAAERSLGMRATSHPAGRPWST